MAFTETVTHTFKTVCCYSCGQRFAIDSKLYQRAVLDCEGYVFCPNCGKQNKWCETQHEREIKAMQKQIDAANERAQRSKDWASYQEEQAELASNRLRATKGVVTRLKNKMKASAEL